MSGMPGMPEMNDIKPAVEPKIEEEDDGLEEDEDDFDDDEEDEDFDDEDDE